MPNKKKISASKDTLSPKKNRGAKNVKKPVRKKRSQEINTVEDFIIFAYSRKGQQIGFKKKIIEEISKAPKLNKEVLGRLLALTHDDKTLAVPKQLLFFAMDIKEYPTLKNTIKEFVKHVLSKNTVFLSSGVVDSLINKPDAPDPKSALIKLARLDYSKINNPSGVESITPKDLEKLKINSVYTLAVWFSETRHLSLDLICEYLFEALWSPSASSLKEGKSQLKALTEISTLAGAGVACQIYADQVVSLKRTTNQAIKKQKILEDENQNLHEENEKIRARLKDSAQRIKDLSEELEKEQQAHDYTKLCLKDDIEQLRSRLLRRLKAEVTLLDEGLHALRKEPPKVHVMEDHTERALDELKNEIEFLDRENE